MAQLRARRFAPYQAADPPVATVVMLARSLAADNVAALAALCAHRTKPYDRRDGGGDGMTRPPRDPSSTGELAGLGAGALLVLCSAAPDLLAGGRGATLRNPWLIGIGWAVVLAAIVDTASRIAHQRSSGYADRCRPPWARTADRAAAPPAVERRPR